MSACRAYQPCPYHLHLQAEVLSDLTKLWVSATPVVAVQLQAEILIKGCYREKKIGL
jgi:hypothetical protein